MATPVTKERLHALVEDLPESAWPAAERILRDLTDPLLRTLMQAPEDDEPETPEEAAAVQEAYDAIERGEVYSHAEARRRLLGRE
jgi:hypothetical protein